MVTRRYTLARWWRRTSGVTRTILFLAGISLFVSLVYLQRPTEDSGNFGNNLLVFAIVNFNIIFLSALAFLIGRNIVKLVFERRKNILGSRLRMKLVLAFAGLALVTNIVLFIFAGGLLTKAMEGWFSSQVEASVSAAEDVAKHHYAFLKDLYGNVAQKLAAQLGERSALLQDRTALEASIEHSRVDAGVFSIRVIDSNRVVRGEVSNAVSEIEDFKEPPPERKAIDRALGGSASVLFEGGGSNQFIRSYNPIMKGAEVLGAVLVSQRVNPEVSSALAVVNDSYTEYEQMKLFKNPLRTGYLLSLAMITGVILFSAIWFGFYIAKQLTGPIQQLAEATRVVSRGNYDFQIRVVGDDEIGFLVKSFNSMIADLKASRSEAERRRVFIETILSNLAVAVIALDTSNRLTSINSAAGELFGIPKDLSVAGKALGEVLGQDALERIQPVLDEMSSADQRSVDGAPSERELSILADGAERKVLCTVGELRDDRGGRVGTVLLFDDITELSKAQHMSAWREVARRIAHEIKNPLTPIQLSAQRIQKLLGEQVGSEPLKECAQTIVENVDSIKRLANEFTNFARMPTTEFRPSNLNALISDVVSSFASTYSDVVFQFIADNKMPDVQLDREQIRRVLMNLIDNAISALFLESFRVNPEEGRRILIKSFYDRSTKTASFEVADNGPGISNPDKIRVFEPYFTTKKGGTGLGLAIVTTIIADHQGDIRVFDNQPHGAKFSVDLPINPKVITQRRFAVG